MAPPVQTYTYKVLKFREEEALQPYLDTDWELMFLAGANESYPDIGNSAQVGAIWLAVMRKKHP
jgi:hypothetical protein